jgi:FlaG/FlaF family flagellin (archaellin)
MKTILAIALAVLLAACGQSSIEGTFTAPNDKIGFQFTADGKVRVGNKETTYTIEDNTLKFQFSGGLPFVFTLNSDGSISWAGQGKYTKR